ncbi:MAG: acyl-CoA dehydrogenase family protein [Hyphomicrobiales bacterium]
MNASELVATVAADILRYAGQAEQERKLPDELVRRLQDAGIFGIYTPKQFGGLGLPFPDALRVVEEVSRYDGSTGWTVALCFGNDFFTCVLPEESAAKVLGNGRNFFAGAPGFMVRAVVVEGGYRISGRWSFCSGAPNAPWYNVAAPVYDGETPRMGPDGPVMIAAWMPPDEVEVIDTWNVTGLRATGSHDLCANNLFVPTEMTGPMGIPAGPQPQRESVMAKLPFFSALGIAQAPPVCLGIARHAIEEFIAVAESKVRPMRKPLSETVQAHLGVARAEALLQSARSYWYEQVQAAYDRVASGGQLSPAERVQLRLASLTAAENCVAAVDQLYRLAGTSGLFESSVLGRCWRDIHAAAQHQQVQDERWETVGRLLFGLEPDGPIF